MMQVQDKFTFKKPQSSFRSSLLVRSMAMLEELNNWILRTSSYWLSLNPQITFTSTPPLNASSHPPHPLWGSDLDWFWNSRLTCHLFFSFSFSSFLSQNKKFWQRDTKAAVQLELEGIQNISRNQHSEAGSSRMELGCVHWCDVLMLQDKNRINKIEKTVQLVTEKIMICPSISQFTAIKW